MFHAHTLHNEWVVYFGCTHHIVKDASLFSSLGKYVEQKINVSNNFSLDIGGYGGIPCQHSNIVNVYHVPSLSANLLSISQLT